jgi:NADH-quinone oxidoreductase subunit J
LALEQVLFYVFGAMAVLTSLLVIGQKNPIYSVLLLIASFAALAGLYVLLDAPFAAVVQIIVYAGAIMVLFLFVVMLLNLPQENEPGEYIPVVSPAARIFGAVLSLGLVVELGWALTRRANDLRGLGAGGQGSAMTVREIGATLFRVGGAGTEPGYAFAFEVTSILILVAMVGAVVLAERVRPER